MLWHIEHGLVLVVGLSLEMVSSLLDVSRSLSIHPPAEKAATDVSVPGHAGRRQPVGGGKSDRVGIRKLS